MPYHLRLPAIPSPTLRIPPAALFPHLAASHPCPVLACSNTNPPNPPTLLQIEQHFKDQEAELVEKSRALAAKLGFERMSFLHLSVQEAALAPELPAQIDLVTALHACDTATDDAIAFGLQKKARAMVLVPCCQAELARHLNAHKALNLRRTPLAELWRHPLHTREIGSQLTNVLRCLYLQASGYQVSVTELVGWEHSMKNELIIARYTGQHSRQAAQRLRELLQEFGLDELLHTRFTLPQDNAGAP